MSDPNQWLYVWLSYGLTAVVLGGYWVRLRLRRQRADRALRNQGETR